MAALEKAVKTQIVVGDGQKEEVTQGPLVNKNQLEDVTAVLAEAPERLADSLILFCQGLGLVPSVQRKISRSQSVVSQTSSEEQAVTKTRKVSMEMFDIPDIRRLSLSSHNI